MKTIYYRITLHEPTILTQIEGEPNSAVSYDFIPGSVLRGIVIGMYQRGELNLADKTINRLFFSNHTRFLNAYPVINDKRGLPVPISWRKPKYGDANIIYDEAIYDEALSQKQTYDKRSSVKGFAITDKNTAYTYHPQRVLNVHTQRKRKQRTQSDEQYPQSDKQLVYRYDALAPHQTFEAILYCQDEDADLLASLLDNQQTHIGGARSAGYGRVSIQVSDKLDDGWMPEIKPRPDNKIVITLLSDMILRDKNGHYSPTLPAFGYAFRDVDMQFTFGINHVIQTTLIGGFNRKWGLPLPQTPAFKRGSVIVLKNVEGNSNDLNQLIADGIGERRNEGFGQIAVNWQQHCELKLPEDKKPEISKRTDIPEPVFAKESDDERVWLILKKGLGRLKEGGKKDEQPK